MDEGIELLERLDHHSPLRNWLREVAAEKETWSGIPMPLEGERLVIEPTYPRAKELMHLANVSLDPPDPNELIRAKVKVRNSFWSWHRRCEIVVYETPEGKIKWGFINGNNHLDMELRTMGCSEAWGIEQERNALDLLGTLIRHHAFKKYLMTGMFLETSPRSGVTYLFRKLRPTIAIHVVDGTARIMCALCAHTVGYYDGSWAGAMCATDDVIAHLVMMRGDEHRFWKMCNQHPSWVPQAGI